MKPRLNLRHGVWACHSFWPYVVGCGKTPRQAYDEWKRQQINACRPSFHGPGPDA